MDIINYLDQHVTLEQYPSKFFCPPSKIIKQCKKLALLLQKFRKTICGLSFLFGMQV